MNEPPRPLPRDARRCAENVGEDSVVVAALQRAAQFRGFPAIQQGEAFHRVDASGALDLVPLALRINEPDPGPPSP